MKKTLLFFLFVQVIACTKLPTREEMEFRNRLEDAIVKTFPKKVEVIIIPFTNTGTKNKDTAYLDKAVPDMIESSLESLRYTLAYIPFEGMPFYVSEEISNLVQPFSPETDEEEEGENFDEQFQADIFNSDKEEKKSHDAVYFSYLTNYLQLVPTLETQISYELTTNTNYFKIYTNTEFINGDEHTNFTSNEVLLTKTNTTLTNLITVKKSVLTPTNMLLLIQEEFPELVRYLSYLPIEVRQASTEDIKNYTEYTTKLKNPEQWYKKKRKEISNQKNTPKSEDTTGELSNDPSEPFIYRYYITGSIASKSKGPGQPVETDIRTRISPVDSTGNDWWMLNNKNVPPRASELLKYVQKLEKTSKKQLQLEKLRTPYTKPKMSTHLAEQLKNSSTNFIEEKPELPNTDWNNRKTPISLRARVLENKIPEAILNWQKNFHAAIVNRPYTVLRVKTDVPDTMVYLNGFYIGKTPLVYPTAPLGPQRVTFVKKGFNREEILTEIIPNQTNSIVYSMTTLNNSGEIQITSSLQEAEVYINSEYKGRTPITVKNLSLNSRYRIEVLNPKADLTSNRNSVYKDITLTENKSKIAFNAKFKTFETTYRTPGQKALLASTYISWILTASLMGGSIYTLARYRELQALSSLSGISDAQRKIYAEQSSYYALTAQATLYSSLAGLVVSSGLLGWYLYSKDIYLGLDIEQREKEWYANFKLKF